MKPASPLCALHNTMWVWEQGYSSSSEAKRAPLPAGLQIQPKYRLSEVPLVIRAATEFIYSMKQEGESPRFLHKEGPYTASEVQGMNVQCAHADSW